MKQALIALDGGGSNLRMLIVDKETEEELYFAEIPTGTNLSSVPNKEEALNNIKSLIKDGYLHIPRDYILAGIALSSAGTEIKENKVALEQVLEEVVEILKISSDRANDNPPKLYVTNDIEILLHSADIAVVAGTGTVGAVKYQDITPYDNTDEPAEYIIKKFDGNGQYLGDKGAGFWIGNEALKRVAEIEDARQYVNSKGRIVVVLDEKYPQLKGENSEEDIYIYDEEIDEYEKRIDKIPFLPDEDIEIEYAWEGNMCMRQMVFERVFEELGISQENLKEILEKGLKESGYPDFVELVYKATADNGKPYDRAKVGNMFSKIADVSALYGDKAAYDILKQASIEIFKNIKAAYERGNLRDKEECTLLLSGSVLVHSKMITAFIQSVVSQNYPKIHIKVNNEKPVLSTIRYMKDKLDNKEQAKEDDDKEIEI